MGKYRIAEQSLVEGANGDVEVIELQCKKVNGKERNAGL